MLPPFHIRNLQPSNPPKASHDTLVRINAPVYDETISSHPAATLKYHDEDDGDLITLGSSRELAQRLEEPYIPRSSGLSAKLLHGLQSSEHHVFDIDDRDDHVRKLWLGIQSSSKASENVPVTRDWGGATKWSEEMKNILAVSYEKRRSEIWSPIAKDLGVPWQSVDAMHWALGEGEMSRRAHELRPCPQQSGSSEEIAGSKSESSNSALFMREFEEHRVHHFSATRPPQVHLPMPLTLQPIKNTAGQATLPRLSNVGLGPSASSIVGQNGEEGKRQAQAAGETLRARTTISRRKGTMTALDSHQNRWANYKSSSSASLPKASTSVSQAFNGAGLTSEGKRQAQVAGDKLRSRTNPIRHSRPSGVGSLERGIYKNRWSSYSGMRATRFDQRQDAQEGARDTSCTTDTDEEPRDRQPSLLEVFEAELAKFFLATVSEEAPEAESALRVNPSSETSTPAHGQPLPQGPHAFLGLINERLQELTTRDVALPRDVSTALDHGIRTAVSGVGTCMQGIARRLQEVSSVSRQAADRTRDADLWLFDDAILGLRSLTGGFIAALGREVTAKRDRTASAPCNGTGEIENSPNSTALGISRDRDPDEDAITAQKSDESPLNGDVDSFETAFSSRYMSENPASTQLERQPKPGPRPAMDKEAQFHRMGPVQVSNRRGCCDHLRRSQSTKTFDEQFNPRHATSPPVDTQFPTLAQFEGESFGAAPSFSSLPSMEPPIPQPAPRQPVQSGPADGIQSYGNGPNGVEASQRSHAPTAGSLEQSAQRNGHGVTPLSRRSLVTRVVGPFDPLEAGSSSWPHSADGIRRNGTIASTGIGHATRRRRPYSEVFDGSGRVAWGAFLQDNGRRPRGLRGACDDRGRPLSAHQGHSVVLSRREEGPRRSPLAASWYDDEHHNNSTVSKMKDCVEQLRQLGFGGDNEYSAGRLLVYAQAADGVLVDAIDLIDEEQRAYRERL